MCVSAFFLAVTTIPFGIDLFQEHPRARDLLVSSRSGDTTALARARALHDLSRDTSVVWEQGDTPSRELLRLVPSFRALIESGPLRYPHPEEGRIARWGDPLAHAGLRDAVRFQMREDIRERDPAAAAEKVGFLIRSGRSLRDAGGPSIHYAYSLRWIEEGARAAGEWLEATRKSKNDPGEILVVTSQVLADTDEAWKEWMAADYAWKKKGSRGADWNMMRLFSDPEGDLLEMENGFLEFQTTWDRPFLPDRQERIRIRDAISSRRKPANHMILFRPNYAEWGMAVMNSRVRTAAYLGALRAACEVRRARRKGDDPERAWEALPAEIRTNPASGEPFLLFDTPPAGLVVPVDREISIPEWKVYW